jgi:hypothetical protein
MLSRDARFGVSLSPARFGRIFAVVRTLILFVLVAFTLAGCASNRAPEPPPSSNRIFESPDVDSLH